MVLDTKNGGKVDVGLGSSWRRRKEVESEFLQYGNRKIVEHCNTAAFKASSLILDKLIEKLRQLSVEGLGTRLGKES